MMSNKIVNEIVLYSIKMYITFHDQYTKTNLNIQYIFFKSFKLKFQLIFE